ncbi:glycoside hydrolase superfamily [Naematelia encephala]|uniref:Beta-hexosaminidase n=1 Tax=Naematelia encephala TaxID=71784 RepID=A0A1Y2AUU4_9TREE|nr:glycoside hydrolase superfamily [Naematelia encephala]
MSRQNLWTAISLFLPLVTTCILLFSSSTTASTSPLTHNENIKSSTSGRLDVLPIPTQYSTGHTVLCLSSTFEITTSFPLLPDLKDAIERTNQHLSSDRHQYLSPTRGLEFFNNNNNNNNNSNCAIHLPSLHLDLTSSSDKVKPILSYVTLPSEDRPESESYTLSVPLSGPAKLVGKTPLGLLRGLTTFEHLFYHLPTSSSSSQPTVLARPDSLSQSQQLPLGSTNSEQVVGTGSSAQTDLDGTTYAPFAPYEIEDKPAFGWRAVLLDTSRNYFSVPSILKMLDTMAMVKLNVFHWHITDSNSWPLDLSTHPELAQAGAYSPSDIYSEADIRHIIQYAGDRGIDVMLEIDTPGHTAIIAESHPELIACYQASPWQRNAHQPPPGQLRFADPAVAEFVNGLFTSTLGLVSGPYFGTGGDEINENCMLQDEQTAQALERNAWTLDDALDDFTAKTHATIRQQGKTPVVWQEMVLDHGEMPSLGKDTIVSIWVNSADARRVLDKGHRIIQAAGDYFYLDCGQGGWIGQEGGGNSWCDPFKTWMRMYSFDPYKDVSDEQKKLVLGGQASLWAEQTDETNFEQVLWPRAAAVAELFWTGAGQGSYPRSAIEALPRMHDVRYRMVDRGVNAVPLQPHWCALRPGVCVMGA